MSNVWLALTAIDELWKTDSEVVFLGPWCITQYNKQILENLSYSILDEKKWFIDWEKSNKYFLDFYEKCFDALCMNLNEIHGENHLYTYWKKAFLPWMKTWFHNLLFDYYSLEIAIKKFPGCKIMTYDTGEEVNWRLFELDKFDVEEQYKYDLFHLCIYNVILDFLKKRKDLFFEIVYLDNPYKLKNVNINADNAGGSSIKKYILKKFFAKADICMEYLYVENVKKFWISHRGKVAPVPNFYYSKSKNTDLRKKIIIQRDINNTFFDFVLHRFWIDLPVEFLEGYKTIQDQVNAYFTHIPRYIMSSNTMVSAMLWEKGAKTVGMTHNVLYGLLNSFQGLVPCSTEEFDIYYVWGKNQYNNTRICPTFKFAPPKETSYPKDKIYWFFSGNEENRYLSVFDIMTGMDKTINHVESSIKEYINFCKNLQVETADMIYYRMRDPWGFGMEKIIHHANALLKKDENIGETPAQLFGGLISEKLYSSKMIICNSFYTAVLYEALVRNVPVIIIRPEFTEHELNCFWEDIPQYFSKLKKLGIWFTDGKQAALFLNKHLNDIELWWNEPQRQVVISAFTERVCMKTENAGKWWKNELFELMN